MNICIIILLNFIVYFRTLKYGMVIDDNCRKFHEKDLKKNWFIRAFRITRYSGYGGVSLPVDHLITILLHTSVCVMIYLVFGANRVSLLTALLFSVYAANSQVSIWLNGKRYAIAAMLMLGMWSLKALGLPLYLVSLMWHHGTLPGVLMYVKTPYSWMLWGLLLLLIISWKELLNRIGCRLERIPHGEIKRIRPKKLVILIKMFGYSFLHCLFPRRLSFYHMFMERFGFSKEDNDYWYSFNKDFWIGLLTLTTVIWLTVVNWGNPIGLGLYWWVIFSLPWFQFPIGLTQAISERTFYIPNIGLVYAICSIIPDTAFIALFVYHLVKLWNYMPAYMNLDNFYRYALHEFPDHFRARGHVVKNEVSSNKLFWALKNCGEGLNYHPKDCTLNLLMAQCLIAIGMWDRATEYLNKVEANLIPGQESYMLNTTRQFREAIKQGKNHPVPPKKQMDSKEVVDIDPSQIVENK